MLTDPSDLLPQALTCRTPPKSSSSSSRLTCSLLSLRRTSRGSLHHRETMAFSRLEGTPTCLKRLTYCR